MNSPARSLLAGSVASILLSFICLSMTAWLLFRKNSDKETQADTEYSGVCLECARLGDKLQNSEHYNVFNMLEKRSQGGKQMCCADTTAQMAALMELFGPTEPLVTYDAKNFTFSSASAHKRLHPSTIFRGDVPQFSDNENCALLFDPENDDALTEHVRNVEVLSSGYHILQSGWYYVYNNLHFRPDSSKPCKDYKFQTWESLVIRSRPNDRQNSGTILRSVHTCCDNCTRDKETRYTAGVFYLQANDHLHVEVSGSGLISFQKQSSFFGLALQGHSEFPLQGQILGVEKGLSNPSISG